MDRLVRVERSEDTFEKIGREWYAKQSEAWVPEHAARILSRLERDIFPFLGGRPITAIETPELLGVLRRIEARGVTVRGGLLGAFHLKLAQPGRVHSDRMIYIRDSLDTGNGREAVGEPGM